MRPILFASMLLFLALPASADTRPASEGPPAAACPDPAPPSFSTEYVGDRAWIHEPGWFASLDDPKTLRVADETYKDETPFMTVGLGGELRAYPIPAMAYHHVSNDLIGGEAVVVTY